MYYGILIDYPDGRIPEEPKKRFNSIGEANAEIEHLKRKAKYRNAEFKVLASLPRGPRRR
jgi:hypothetical protein